jgi:hypothetical protein
MPRTRACAAWHPAQGAIFTSHLLSLSVTFVLGDVARFVNGKRMCPRGYSYRESWKIRAAFTEFKSSSYEQCDQVTKPHDHSYASRMPAVGALVRCTDGSWMTRPPQSCPRGHRLGPGAMLVGHQPCSTCRGGHTTWTCLDCGGVVYGPPLTADCRVLVGAAAVR